MAGKLTAKAVEALKEPGRYSDGDNLYLSISANGGKRWVFLYRWQGRKREMGIGSAAAGQTTLADARKRALDARKLLSDGIDPLADKDAKAKAAIAIPTFGAFVDEFIQIQKPGFKNAKHVAQWEMTMGDAYCKVIRAKPINTITTEHVLKVLQPIWQKVPETASRIRGRLENVFDAAKVRGFYTGENPARWKGHLKAILPARQKLTRGHHAAMPYANLPQFMRDLRQKDDLSACALEFTILCAARTSETLKATWAEIDVEKAIWTIPPARMKAGVEHRVPLPARCLELLSQMDGMRRVAADFVFPGYKRDKPLSEMTMLKLLDRMGHPSATVHGFRSSFRDWAAEEANFPHDVCEMALAHTVGNKAEAAYRRGDLLEKRRGLMAAWANYCDGHRTDNVVLMRAVP